MQKEKGAKVMGFNIKEGKKYDIRIHDLGDSGEGVGRIEGMTVFVDGLVPGDRALVQIIKVKKNYAIATFAWIMKYLYVRIIVIK